MICLLISSIAHASEAAEVHHGPVEIPWSAIGVQAFNLIFLLVVLGLILRKSVRAHFASRAKDYTELVNRAESARSEAEKTHNEVKEKLAKLESSAEQSVLNARQEAAELRIKMMAEAKALSEKMASETKRVAAYELEKAKAEIRKELLLKSLASSEASLKKGLDSNEQKKLQNEFAEKIGVVGG